MKLLVDMNLSPDWCEVLRRGGWEAVHWSSVGDPRATDAAIMQFAREHGYVVFTHDLDFGTLLSATQAIGPSVIQLRSQDVLPARFGMLVLDVLRDLESALTEGALVTIDEARTRMRVLPLSK